MTVAMRCAFFVLVLAVVKCQDYFDYDSETPSCKLKNGRPGTCTPLNDCPSAIEALRRRERPVNCWFNRRNPIVCCQVSENLAVSKSEQKCMESHKNLTSDGGIIRVSVVGGVKALSKQFRHMAVLGFGDQADITWACGGSLISENFVLTAAHCLNTKELGEVKFIRLGDLNLKQNDDDADPQDFTVTRKIRHPQYKPPSQYHDIALIELDRPAKMSVYVKPACIHTSKNIVDPVWIATGWGNVEFGGVGSDHLQKVNLREFKIEECNQFYKANSRRLADGILETSQICAGEQNKDTCQGDSGGPLQIQNPDHTDGYRIIGITSFGKACGISSSPGIYTRVSNYVGWIESIVWPN